MLSLNQTITGKVTAVKPFGIFIQTEQGDFGLCHISECADSFIEDIELLFTKGQEVTAIVYEIKDGKNNLSIKRYIQQQNRIKEQEEAEVNKFEDMLKKMDTQQQELNYELHKRNSRKHKSYR